MNVGDIVKIKSIPGTRRIITNINKYIYVENSSFPFFESELEIHEDQIKLNNRLQNLKQIGI
jgi:hypothetical protein